MKYAAEGGGARTAKGISLIRLKMVKGRMREKKKELGSAVVKGVQSSSVQ